MEKREPPGQKWIQELEEFYISYGNWRTEYPENFRCFSLIKRIAEISLYRGHYISDKEEEGVVAHLSDIKEGLYAGNIRHADIRKSMNAIVLDLIEHNPKAKLIAHLIELEYFFHDSKHLSERKKAGLELVYKLISRVTPEFSETSAHSAAKEISMLLAKLMKDKTTETEILLTLENAIRNWL